MTTCQLLHRIFIASVACLFMAVAPCVQAEWLVIDDFESPAGNDTYICGYWDGAQWDHTSASPTGILGGERQLSVEVNGTPGLFSASGYVGHDGVGSEGVFQMQTGSSPGSKATALYDGIGASTLGGANLTVGSGFDGILIEFESLDTNFGNPMEVTINVDGTSGPVSLTTLVDPSTDPFYHFVYLDDPDWNGFDFTSVNSIEFVFNPNSIVNADFTMDFIGIGKDPAIPEPSTMALLSVGFIVLAVQGWRRRRTG